MEIEKKVLFYDLETSLLELLGFSLGKQVVRHTQLLPENQTTKLICLTYCWNDGKPGQALIVDNHNIKDVITEFDKMAEKADVIIGKNSDRFDNKHINTQRLLAGLPGCPSWLKHTDDLEKQFRKHFNLPSQSLDFVSNLLELGGKDKMSFTDWVKIHCFRKLQRIEELTGKESAQSLSKFLFNKSYTAVMQEGRQALNKMVTYGIKDVEDTREIWNYAESHFQPKFNLATKYEGLRCKHCGSDNIRSNGSRPRGKTMYKRFMCYNLKCNHNEAGYAPIKADGTYGKIG